MARRRCGFLDLHCYVDRREDRNMHICQDDMIPELN